MLGIIDYDLLNENIAKYVDSNTFNIEALKDFLMNTSGRVSGRVFDIALMNTKYGSYLSISFNRTYIVHEDEGYNPVDVETFIRRIPFYFYLSGSRSRNRNNLHFLTSSYEKEIERNSGHTRKNIDKYELVDHIDYEPIYKCLEKMFYEYKMDLELIFSYYQLGASKVENYTIFKKWVEYCELYYNEHGLVEPTNFLLCDLNKLRIANGLEPYRYSISPNDFTEFRTIYTSGDFQKSMFFAGMVPYDQDDKVCIEWINLWVEKIGNIKIRPHGADIKDRYFIEFSIELTDDSRIYWLNNCYPKNEGSYYWKPVYLGPNAAVFSGDELTAYRKFLEMSRETMANITGTSIRTYTNWENGKGQPDADALIKIILKTGASIEWFIEKEVIFDNDMSKYKTGKNPSEFLKQNEEE